MVGIGAIKMYYIIIINYYCLGPRLKEFGSNDNFIRDQRTITALVYNTSK